MWPQAIRAVREIRPKGFLFENVRGLVRPKFEGYLASVLSALRHPGAETRYEIRVMQVNAADFGAPQKRHRVVIAGVRSDVMAGALPLIRPTHSRDRLLWDQFVTGTYWKRHKINRSLDSFDTIDATTVRRLRVSGVKPGGLPWVTVRDALAGLGDPDGCNNHVHQPGARIYKGHTGSPLDQPAKALKAGDHGVPGGENMMIRADGSVRYFTTREAARLQGLPDEFQFPRSWTESMRQLGNAVPCQLAEAVGRWMGDILTTEGRSLRIAA